MSGHCLQGKNCPVLLLLAGKKRKKKKPGRRAGGGTLLGRPFGIHTQPILSRSIALARIQGDRKGYQIWVEAGAERAS